MIFLILVLSFVIAVMSFLLYALAVRVNKMDRNQATMLGYFDTINQNEKILQEDLKKLHYEFHAVKEKAQSQGRPIGTQAQKPV